MREAKENRPSDRIWFIRRKNKGAQMKKNIILIGFMGCGKTTVGKKLAKKMNFTFVDTDQMIERQSNTTISDIFATKGEEYFRDLETNTIRDMVGTVEHTIISSGGGLPLRECNGAILKELGFVVYLSVKRETVLKRLEGDTTRPLLAGDHVEEKVDTLLNFRDPIYEVSAHMVVQTDGKKVDDIAEEIIRNYEIVVGSSEILKEQ